MKQIMVKSSASLQEVITKLEQYNKQFQEKVNDLCKEQKRVDSMWDGQANTEFNNNFNKDKQQFDNFHTEIAQYIKQLKAMKQKYEEAESKNTQIAKTRR